MPQFKLINTNALDVGLFHQYRNHETTGAPVVCAGPLEQRLMVAIQLQLFAFDHTWDPLFPRFNPLRTDLVAVKIAHQLEDPASEEYTLVWRDFVYMFYKHGNRSVYFNRHLKDEDELQQAIWEIHVAFRSHLNRELFENHPKHSELSKLASGQKADREAKEWLEKDGLLLKYLYERDQNGQSAD